MTSFESTIRCRLSRIKVYCYVVLATRLQAQLIEARNSFADVTNRIKRFQAELRDRLGEVQNSLKFTGERINQIICALAQGRETIQVTNQISLWEVRAVQLFSF